MENAARASFPSEAVLDQIAGQADQFILEVRDVRKTYPGVVALDHAELRLRAGTVHAVMGENGAGKSTLMKIIAGISRPDTGEILVKGEPCRMQRPIDAQRHGIAMIHQELNLMGSMTVAENIWIGREPRNALGLINHRAMRRQTLALFAELDIVLDPDAGVGGMSIAHRQMIEIAKAVSFKPDILILDEPTSALTDREVDKLFSIIATLKARGNGLVYITHKMAEVFRIADEVTVFRDGRYIGTHDAHAIDDDKLIRMMVGRELNELFPKEIAPVGEVVLSVRDLSLEGVFSGISFDLRQGEILGLAGLVGAGRTNVAETLFGVTPATSGTIAIAGAQITIDSPRRAMKAGMALLTEDRKDTGCFLLLSVLENMQMAALHEGHVRAGFVRQSGLETECDRMRDTLRVKTPDLATPIVNLSGGNQQKVLIARWLLTNPRILILDEPTRGIDVGAKAEIYRLISTLAMRGVAVIMVSSEMPEILGMSDRVMVMHEGRMTGLLDRKDADQVGIMRLAAA